MVAVEQHVALEGLVHVGLGHGLRRIGHREVAADKVVEGLAVGVGAQDLLDGPPEGLVHVVLLLDRVGHQHEVADEVGRREVLACGVHRLEDSLRLVLPLRERDGDYLKPAQTLPDRGHIVEGAHAPLEEGQVLEQAFGAGDHRMRRVLEVVDERAAGGMIVFGERQLIVVIARAEVVGEVPAVHDLLACEGQVVPTVLTRETSEGNEQQRDGGDTLLAVNEQQRRDALGRHGTVLDGDDRPREVERRALAPTGKDVVPQLQALLLAPRVGPLVHRHHKARVHLCDKAKNAARVGIHETAPVPRAG